jgi:hypothetical protein
MADMSQTEDRLNALCARLHELWNSEGESVDIDYHPTWYGSKHEWMVTLVYQADIFMDDRHSSDWIERRWQFYGDTLDEAMAEALTFSDALVALAPPDDDELT